MTQDIAGGRRAPATRRRKIVIIGYPRFAKPLEAMLRDAAWDFRYSEDGAAMLLPFSDVLYQVGGGHLVPPRLFAMCRVLRKPVVKHWVGTDAESASLAAVRAQASGGRIVNWADSPWIADELRAAGLDATVVSLNHVADAEPSPMPPGPLRVLVYLPDGAGAFYRADTMASLARRMPQASFFVVGGTALPAGAPPNMTLLGIRDDMTAVYAGVHALVRMPRRDGMSFMVTEALAQGRYTVWNRPMTGSVLADDEEGAYAALTSLAHRLTQGLLPLNGAGARYARAEFGARVSIERLHRAFDQALSAGGGS